MTRKYDIYGQCLLKGIVRTDLQEFLQKGSDTETVNNFMETKRAGFPFYISYGL